MLIHLKLVLCIQREKQIASNMIKMAKYNAIKRSGAGMSIAVMSSFGRIDFNIGQHTKKAHYQSIYQIKCLLLLYWRRCHQTNINSCVSLLVAVNGVRVCH